MATDKGVATVKPTKTPPPSRPQTPTARTGGDGFGERAGKYIQEVRTELRKTTWPSKQEVIAQTQVVLGLLLVVGTFIAGWDAILGQIFRGILMLLGVRNPI